MQSTWHRVAAGRGLQSTTYDCDPDAADALALRPVGPTGLELPAGWHRYTNWTGFSVAIPDGWTISRQGSIVYVSEPDGSRLLGIDQTDRPQPDPVADWQAKEQYRLARGDFPSYHRIGLTSVDYFVKAADWEFKAYGMCWSTLDDDWNRDRPDLVLIERSFQPAD